MKEEYPDRTEYRNEQRQYHRLDGPAIEWKDGYKEWFVNSKRHREDGPAIEYSSGINSYYLNDEYYLEEEFHQEIIKIKLNRLINERRISR